MSRKLDYLRDADDVGRPPDLLFWFLYVTCALVGLFLLSVQLEIATWGRPGDRTVALYCIASTLAVSALVGAAYRWLRRLPPNSLLILAVVFGLLAFFPAYVVLYLIF